VAKGHARLLTLARASGAKRKASACSGPVKRRSMMWRDTAQRGSPLLKTVQVYWDRRA